jgi:methylglyoxal synthase
MTRERKNHMTHRKNIALIAHDHKKRDLVDWARFNRHLLIQHELYATGTTGNLLEQELGIHVQKLKSGPLGGDQQIGAKIAEGEIDFLIFFWDPMQPHPHEPDVKALIRLAVVWNVPVACNRASADYMISSPLMSSAYQRTIPEYEAYLERSIAEPVEQAEEPAAIIPLEMPRAIRPGMG